MIPQFSPGQNNRIHANQTILTYFDRESLNLCLARIYIDILIRMNDVKDSTVGSNGCAVPIEMNLAQVQ